MSLPSTFDSADDYFRSCVDFLKSHAWIYQNANTCFVKAGVLECLSADEIDYFTNVETCELNEFPNVKNTTYKMSAPKSLVEFRMKLEQLTPDEAFQEPPAAEFQTFTFKKVCHKKQHEINRLSCLITDLCDENELLIDFGAGLGYLSESIFQKNTSYRILGLESDPKRVEAARQRQRANLPSANQSIVYKQEFITESSAETIESSAQQLLPAADVNWSIVGLHACADLSVTAIRIFYAISRVKRLIIMPCCYHKLEMMTPQKFRNFPLSRSLKQVLLNDADEQTSRYFNRPFLRLACQQTLARWRCCSTQQHALHGEQLWTRALAEAISDEGEGEKVIRRKAEKLGELFAGERLTFEGLCTAYELRSTKSGQSLPWRQQHESKFKEIITKYPSGERLAEGLICLQTTMQKLCENVVLYDRLCYVQECAAAKDLKISTRFIKLMNEALSPRCYALLAEKIT